MADNSEMRYPFMDPARGRSCTLVVAPAAPLFDALTVEHLGCPHRADVSADLDAFYCTACRWNGRISGAWAVDMWHAQQERVRLDALRDEHAYITSTDGCCHCGDGECDGIGCIANLDPNTDDDYEDIENLHALLRQGQAWRVMQRIMDEGELPLAAWMMADEALAVADNRTVTETCERCGGTFGAQGPCDDTCTPCRIIESQSGGPDLTSGKGPDHG